MNIKYLERYELSQEPIIIGLPHDLNDLTNFDDVDSLLKGVLKDLVDERRLTNKFGEITATGVTIQTEGRKIIAIGLGSQEDMTSHKMHKAFGKLFQHLKSNNEKSAQLLFETFGSDIQLAAEAIGYMSYISVYEYSGKKHREDEPFLSEFELTVTSKEPVETHVSKGMVIGQSVNYARDISETPPNYMTPEIFADKISSTFKGKAHVNIQIKDEFDLSDEGYGLITAVGKASENKPRLVTVEYRHPAAHDVKPVALVGKG